MRRILLAILITVAVLAAWFALTLPLHAYRAVQRLLLGRPAPA
ncbi:hypothetical protein ACRAWG_13105 [Methylobacterium sp. P31]